MWGTVTRLNEKVGRGFAVDPPHLTRKHLTPPRQGSKFMSYSTIIDTIARSEAVSR